jgi:hypothetical protein
MRYMMISSCEGPGGCRCYYGQLDNKRLALTGDATLGLILYEIVLVYEDEASVCDTP